MTLGILSADGWGCVPFLLVVWHEVSGTGACRQLGGARSWCGDGYLQESSHQLIFPGLRNSLVVQHPGLGAPTPEAQVQPLAREPRACKVRSMTREKRKKKEKGK